jgi:hypothetical protein
VDTWGGGKCSANAGGLSANIRDKLGACAANLSIFLPRPVTSRQSSVSGVAGFAIPKSGSAAAATCAAPAVAPPLNPPRQATSPPSSRAHVPYRLEFVSEEVVTVALPCAVPHQRRRSVRAQGSISSFAGKGGDCPGRLLFLFVCLRCGELSDPKIPALSVCCYLRSSFSACWSTDISLWIPPKAPGFQLNPIASCEFHVFLGLLGWPVQCVSRSWTCVLNAPSFFCRRIGVHSKFHVKAVINPYVGTVASLSCSPVLPTLL